MRSPGVKEQHMVWSFLERLMKHKHGWVFKHDYFEIIRNPMDLGTVKDS